MPTENNSQQSKDAPYAGASFALLTKHAKEQAITPRFGQMLGASVSVIDTFDTDTLGTFTREVARVGSQLDAARKKDEIAIEMSGCPRGLGSEGSFAPGPLGLGSDNIEVVALVDRERGIGITGRIRQPGHQGAGIFDAWDSLATFAKRMKFPSHGLVSRPGGKDDPRIRKDAEAWDGLRVAFEECLQDSERGLVFVESDLRAHRNPTRMETIGAACDDLLQRMLRICPSCRMPGFGITHRKDGLPCAWCGGATNDWKAEEFCCVACSHVELQPRCDATKADPGNCPRCNP
jgi:hypothetical protein